MEKGIEIEGVKGIYNMTPQKILYEFTSNSNYIYCKDYKTGKIKKTKRLENGK